MMFSLYDPEQVITDYTNSQMKKARAEGETRGRSAGLAEGRSAGLAEGRTEMARNLLKQGVSAEVIARAANLSPQEVAALAAGRAMPAD